MPRQVPEDGVHPGGGKPQIPEKFPPLVCWERPLQVVNLFRGHLFPAQLAQGLHEKAAQPAGRFHVARGCSAELDGGRSDLDCSARPVCQENHFGWHLFG